MACTLKELQDTEFGILCQFDDFCKEHNLEYSLYAGTLLGAIRHDGFIPWDDDIDVIMDLAVFCRFLKLMRKNTLDGIHFSWFSTDRDHPFYFAKLRREGTAMPEPQCANIDIHNGVWIDVFYYISRSDNKYLAGIQDWLFRFGSACAQRSQMIKNHYFEHEDSASRRLITLLPGFVVQAMRKACFFIAGHLGSKDSEYVYADPYLDCLKKIRRVGFKPCGTTHLFNGREFPIPQDYDHQLSTCYGEYMVPKQYPSHVDLDSITV